MNASKRIAPFIAFGGLVLACGTSDPSQERVDIETRLQGELPEIMAPVTAAEIRQGFDWSALEALEELDPDGYPALHYVTFVASTSTQAKLLEELGLHHDAWPLFTSELGEQGARVGILASEPEFEGSVFFSMVPAAVYNAFIEEGQSDPEVMTAMRLREVPPKIPTHDSGAFIYQDLAESGFRYAPEAETSSTQRELRSEEGSDEAVPHIASSRRSLRRLIGFLRGVADAARTAIGEIREAFNGERTLFVRIYPENAEAGFDIGTPLRSAWTGEPRVMRPSTIHFCSVVV